MRLPARDLVAGIVTAIATPGVWITFGLLACAPLGALAGEMAIPASAASVVAGALVAALLGRSVLPTGGLSSPTALLYAAGLSALLADPVLAPGGAPRLAPLLALLSCSVVLMGATMALMGLLRLGSLVKFVPHPVLAGFMNGLALLILLAQARLLFRADATTTGPLPWLQYGAALVAVLTAAAIWTAPRLTKRVPGMLVGLVVGCGAYAALQAGFGAAARPGPMIGPLPEQVTWFVALAPLLDDDTRRLLEVHGITLGLLGLALALVGALETVLNAVATDRVLNTRHEANREIVAFGLANVAAGLLGGLPLVYSRARVAVLQASGAQTRWSAVVVAVATGALYLAFHRLIEWLPMAVCAGIMITVAWSLVDGWSRQTFGRALKGERTGELWLDVALVATVIAVTLWKGAIVAVLFGVGKAVVLFIHSMNRSLVRERYTAERQPSRRVYPPAQEAVLAGLRRQITVLELEGALFFGNTDALAETVDRLGSDARFVILDLKRINSLDTSAVLVLAQLLSRLRAGGRTLMLAGVAGDSRHERALLALDAGGSMAEHFPDVDLAVEACEQRLLATAGGASTDAEVPLAECTLLRGLAADQAARVEAVLEPRGLASGELLFREGDPGDRLFVVTRGSVTVFRQGSGGQRLGQRFVSFSPGMMLGETAMLDGQGRTAHGVADGPTTVYALTRNALERLAVEDPALSARLNANIALHLSERLRHALAAWRIASS